MKFNSHDIVGRTTKLPQSTYVVRVLSHSSRIFNIEVKADSEAQAMTKARQEDYVKRVIQAWESRVR